MITMLCRLIVLPTVLFWPALVVAAEEHAEGTEQPLLSVDPGSAVWTIVLFALLVLVLGKFAWPPILKGLQDRENKIRQDLEQAELAAKQAQQTLKEYQTKLTEARADARKIMEQGRADTQRIADQIKQDAQSQITQMRQRAEADIQAAKEQAINEVFGQTASLSTQIAGRILQREIQPEDQEQLILAALHELAER